MASSEGSSPGPDESMSRERIAQAIRESDKRAITAPEIADRADLTNKTVYKHLDRVVKERPFIKSEQIGSSKAFWADVEPDGGAAMQALYGVKTKVGAILSVSSDGFLAEQGKGIARVFVALAFLALVAAFLDGWVASLATGVSVLLALAYAGYVYQKTDIAESAVLVDESSGRVVEEGS